MPSMKMLFASAGLFCAAPYLVASANARSDRWLQQQTLLQYPCLLTEVSIGPEEIPMFDWFCELNPRDADGVVGVIVPVSGLVLTEEQLDFVNGGATTLFVDGYFVENSVIIIPPDTDELVLERLGGRDPGVSSESSSEDSEASKSSEDDQLLFPMPPTPFGDKTAIFIRVKASDIEPTASAAHLSDETFGTNGDSFNMASQFEACSYGQFTIAPFEGTINGRDIKGGVYEMTLSTPASGQLNYELQSLVTSQLAEELGSSWYVSEGIDHVMYCLPISGFTAYAYFQNYLSVHSNEWCTTPSGTMHEIGHNLNLQHANQGGFEYDDQSGMMGYSYPSLDDSPRMCFNGPKSWQLGWYGNHHIEIDYRTKWTGELVGISDYDKAPEGTAVILRSEIPNRFGEYIYVLFNRAAGVNAGTLEGANQVLISSQFRESTSELLALLNEGNEHVIPDFGGSGKTFRIRVKSIKLDVDPATAEVTVDLSGDRQGKGKGRAKGKGKDRKGKGGSSKGKGVSKRRKGKGKRKSKISKSRYSKSHSSNSRGKKKGSRRYSHSTKMHSSSLEHSKSSKSSSVSLDSLSLASGSNHWSSPSKKSSKDLGSERKRNDITNT